MMNAATEKNREKGLDIYLFMSILEHANIRKPIFIRNDPTASRKGVSRMLKEAAQIAELLRLLANENRLLILCELIDSPKTVGTLVDRLHSITQSALSQHLALLRAHGVVSSRKTGQSVTYAIADRRVEEVIATLKRNYCSREPQPETRVDGEPDSAPNEHKSAKADRIREPSDRETRAGTET